MSKKKETKKTKSEPKNEDFDLDGALSTVNRYLLDGFVEYIADEKIASQKQFDKLYNDYKELK